MDIERDRLHPPGANQHAQGRQHVRIFQAVGTDYADHLIPLRLPLPEMRRRLKPASGRESGAGLQF